MLLGPGSTRRSIRTGSSACMKQHCMVVHAPRLAREYDPHAQRPQFPLPSRTVGLTDVLIPRFSLSPRSKGAWEEIIGRCEEVGVDAFEINFSCPHGLPERRCGRYEVVGGRWQGAGTRVIAAERNLS